MPRLLILCEYPTLLGGERSMLATLPAVVEAGFDVYVAAPPVGPLADALSDRGVPVCPWSPHGELCERIPTKQLRARLQTLIEQLQPAIVHANSVATSRIAGPVVIEDGIPSIGHLRDILKLSPQAIADINCNSRLLAVSRATRDFHVARGLDAPKCYVLYNGVDLDQFAPRRPTGVVHGELGVPANARFVITIGQLGLRKATDVVLTAARQIAGDVPDVQWLIVGERTSVKQESLEFEAVLHELAEEPPLAGRVHFLGSRNDVARLLNECVLLVHAARQEPLGRVLLEASASGLPVVATDVGGTREIFPTPDAGAILVPPEDPRALAEGMLSVLCDEPHRLSMAQAARRRAVAAFDIRAASQRLVEQYRLAMGE